MAETWSSSFDKAMNEAMVLPAAFARKMRQAAEAEALAAPEALARKRPRSTTGANDKQPRARKKPRRDRPKGGKLEGITNLPLDILFEIFKHLNPVDLLHLASCKARTEPFYHPGIVGQPLSLEEGACQHAKILIAACGLDSETATFGDMEATNITLTCITCGVMIMNCASMDWRQAFLHSVHCHRATYELTDVHTQWCAIVYPELLEEIRRKQIEALEGGHREVTQCPVSGCRVKIVCSKFCATQAWALHRAMAHKDLRRAADVSLFDYYTSGALL